jgi:hypothetical protein
MSENLQAVFYDKAETEPGFAIAYALMQLAHAGNGIAEAAGDLADAAYRQVEATETLAKATDRCATHLKYLGVGDVGRESCDGDQRGGHRHTKRIDR